MPFIKSTQIVLLLFFSLFACAVSDPPDSPISEIRAIIARKALRPPPAEALARLNMDRLTKGLRSFDSHALYIPPALTVQKPPSSLRLGLDIFEYKSRIWVKPDPSGPAGRQGIPEIGELRGVNNNKVTGKLDQVSMLIDQAINDKFVVLDIYDGKDKQYSVQPAPYKTSPVTTNKIGKYVFIRIADFISHQTAPSFLGLYRTMGQNDADIILDLRGCPGGDLFEALEIAGMFVPAGLPLITTYDRTGKVQAYASPTGVKLTAPFCILIDNRTASAAEILAGILKKNSVTRLFGERSYGKCESQTIFNLANGGELWLTTLAIHFSDDSSCTIQGVQPDVVFPDISIAGLASIKDRIMQN